MVTEALASTRWSRARWFVVAPHPDDETLGAGSLIAHAALRRSLGGIAYLTDGTGSHPPGTPRLAVVRRAEARRALFRLGAGAVGAKWIGWPDARPHVPDSAAFFRDAGRLAAVLRRHRIDAVAVSDVTDAHCDHVAAYHLVDAAIRLSRRRIALFAYHVWGGRPRRARSIVTPPMLRGVRRHALRAHRSQLSPILGDGFRLPREKLRMRAVDTLTLRKGGR